MLLQKIRAMCIENGYFTDGSENQYRRMFYIACDVLVNQTHYTIHDVASIIHICSDEEYAISEIEHKLNEIYKECGYNVNS